MAFLIKTSNGQNKLCGVFDTVQECFDEIGNLTNEPTPDFTAGDMRYSVGDYTVTDYPDQFTDGEQVLTYLTSLIEGGCIEVAYRVLWSVGRMSANLTFVANDGTQLTVYLDWDHNQGRAYFVNIVGPMILSIANTFFGAQGDVDSQVALLIQKSQKILEKSDIKVC